MLDKLRKQVAVEFEQLDKLIEVHRPLLDKCENTAPTDIELSALAAMMHSFYTGLENIFKRVAVEMDGTLPTGPSWHRELLDSMSEPTGRRAQFFQRNSDIVSRSISSFDTFSGRLIRSSLNGRNYLHWYSGVKARYAGWKSR